MALLKLNRIIGCNKRHLIPYLSACILFPLLIILFTKELSFVTILLFGISFTLNPRIQQKNDRLLLFPCQ